MIYCNGDSFVAGVELADHILPDYPGLSDWAEWPDATMVDKKLLAKQWIEKTYDAKHPMFNVRQSKMKELIRIEYESAFPNKLQQRLNVPVINHALGGSSMDRIVRTTIADLIELKKTHDNIIAVIGTTFKGRSEVANFEEVTDNYDLFYKLRPWLCVTTNYDMALKNDDFKSLQRYKVFYEKNYHQTVNFYRNVVMLQDFCKVNNIKLHWISTYNDIQHGVVFEDEYESCADLPSLMEYANFKCTLDMRQIAIDTQRAVICPSGHFSEIVHHQTAQLLIPILQGELNVYMD